MQKRLYKSDERKIAGVCGGIAEYFEVDPTLIRIGAAFLVLFAGGGLLAYIIAAILMPDKPKAEATTEAKEATEEPKE